jgi:hypothetical protein
MLDTVALTLERHQFEILQPDRFSPSAKGLLVPPFNALGGRGNFQCVQNPNKTELVALKYLPRLTLAKRKIEGGFAITLRIEFSAPKLLFENNFDELETMDFGRIVDLLHEALATMGVRVSKDALRSARVSAIHYSKNIAFTDFTTCSMVTSELDLIDLDGRLDLSHTDYRNEGHAIRYHANSFEVTFYDKLKDLQRARYSQKRGLEKDYGKQLEMFKGSPAVPKQFEVLRMEVRLGNRTKIRSILKRVKSEAQPVFAALFNADLSKQVLMHFWSVIRSQLALLGAAKKERPEDVLSALAGAAGHVVHPGKLFQQLGLITLVSSVGLRGAHALMARYCTKRSWQRYKRDLKSLPLDQRMPFSALRKVDAALAAFEPLRMESFQSV